MHRVLILSFLVSVAITGRAQTPAGPAAVPAANQRPVPAVTGLTDDEKTIYALGLLMQQSIRTFDLSPEELDIVKRAISDGAAGMPAIKLDDWGPRIDPLASARGVRRAARETAAGAAYVEKAAAEAGAVRTPSGLIYRDITIGTGRSPAASDTVKVHYRGTFIDGAVFDSSYDRNEPASFALREVLPCWTEGVQRMRIGGKARLVCAPDIAYGAVGSPPTIPGGATLVFEVELLEIVGR